MTDALFISVSRYVTEKVRSDFMECKFKRICKNANTDKCNIECFPYVVLHGTSGDGGYWGSRRTPKKYDNCFLDTLPIAKDNPKAYGVISKYCKDVLGYALDKRVGLFLYSIPNKDNRLGTGTGKTTSAITILNEYLIARVKQQLEDGFKLGDCPVMFIKLSELQNIYNAQFRGTREIQEESSIRYYRLKKRMMTTELLVVDDVGVRDLTDAFKNELFEIIDHRATEEVTTICTSNYPLDKLNEFLGERIVSRIDGMTYKLGFEGKDHRQGGLF